MHNVYGFHPSDGAILHRFPIRTIESRDGVKDEQVIIDLNRSHDVDSGDLALQTPMSALRKFADVYNTRVITENEVKPQKALEIASVPTETVATGWIAHFPEMRPNSEMTLSDLSDKLEPVEKTTWVIDLHDMEFRIVSATRREPLESEEE